MNLLIPTLLLMAAFPVRAELVTATDLGSKVFVPACAEYDRSADCTLRLGETYRVLVLTQGRTANVTALGKDYNSDKHRWLVAVSDYQHDFAVPAGCVDETVRNEQPRITFEPRFVPGCAQPDEYFWINVTPTAWGCGFSDKCTAVLYIN